MLPDDRTYESFASEIGYALSDLGDQVASEQLPKYFSLPEAPEEAKAPRKGISPNLGVYGLLLRLGTNFSSLTHDLEQHGLTEFKYLRSSRSGICFESVTPRHNKVIVMLRDNPPARAPIPQQLQSLCCFNSSPEHINIEILPKLDVMPEGDLPPAEAEALEGRLRHMQAAVSSQEGPAQTRYYIVDSARRNIGTASDNKTVFYIDGDGIRYASERAPGVVMDPNYVDADGTWLQYKLYEEEHRAFNSPLHRENGKGIPLEIIAETPMSGKHTQRITLGGGHTDGKKTVRLIHEPERRHGGTTQRITLGGSTSRLIEKSAPNQSSEGTSTGPLRLPPR